MGRDGVRFFVHLCCDFSIIPSGVDNVAETHYGTKVTALLYSSRIVLTPMKSCGMSEWLASLEDQMDEFRTVIGPNKMATNGPN